MLLMQHAGPHHFLHLDVGRQLQHSCKVGLNHALAYNILTPTPVPGKRPLQPTTQTKLMLQHLGLPQPQLCPYPIPPPPCTLQCSHAHQMRPQPLLREQTRELWLVLGLQAPRRVQPQWPALLLPRCRQGVGTCDIHEVSAKVVGDYQ